MQQSPHHLVKKQINAQDFKFKLSYLKKKKKTTLKTQKLLKTKLPILQSLSPPLLFTFIARVSLNLFSLVTINNQPHCSSLHPTKLFAPNFHYQLFFFFFRDNYNMLLTPQFKPFPPKPPSTLCMRRCQFNYKAFGHFQLFI